MEAAHVAHPTVNLHRLVADARCHLSGHQPEHGQVAVRGSVVLHQPCHAIGEGAQPLNTRCHVAQVALNRLFHGHRPAELVAVLGKMEAILQPTLGKAQGGKGGAQAAESRDLLDDRFTCRVAAKAIPTRNAHIVEKNLAARSPAYAHLPVAPADDKAR